jgi:hypothetical protein
MGAKKLLIGVILTERRPQPVGMRASPAANMSPTVRAVYARAKDRPPMHTKNSTP